MPDEMLELQFDAFSLPTAQHRAGLAGLLVLTESLRRRRISPRPQLTSSENGQIDVRLTQASLQTLFEDLYDASWEQRSSNAKPQGKAIRKVRRVAASQTKNAGGERGHAYTYEAITPKAAFLKALGMSEPWLKLWREAVWSTVRGIPMTRTPYVQRLGGYHVGEAETVWAELQKAKRAQAKARPYQVEIAGSLFLGAQASNADKVPFRGMAHEAFLLHFWPVVMGVYVPEVIDRAGQTRFAGYVLALPDVVDPENFGLSFTDTVAQLGTELAAYRPRAAVISLPQEGGLEYLHHLLFLATAKAEAGEVAYSIAGVEVYHLEKQGNSIHILATDRVVASRPLLQEYDAIRGRYRETLFKRQIILNLLRGESWYHGFDRVFAQNDWERFVGSRAERFTSDVQQCLSRPVDERRSA